MRFPFDFVVSSWPLPYFVVRVVSPFPAYFFFRRFFFLFRDSGGTVTVLALRLSKLNQPTLETMQRNVKLQCRQNTPKDVLHLHMQPH